MFVGTQHEGIYSILYFAARLSNLSKNGAKFAKKKKGEKMLCVWWRGNGGSRGYGLFGRWVSWLCCFRIFEEREFMHNK